jgi:hypothetical protein
MCRMWLFGLEQGFVALRPSCWFCRPLMLATPLSGTRALMAFARPLILLLPLEAARISVSVMSRADTQRHDFVVVNAGHRGARAGFVIEGGEHRAIPHLHEGPASGHRRRRSDGIVSVAP